MSDADATLDSLFIYPVKSCAGLHVAEQRILPTGLENDRHWMIVDPDGEFLTQRSHPGMALLGTEVDAAGTLTLHAAGHEPLHVAPTEAQHPIRVRVWRDHLDALDAGEAAAAWVTEALRTPARLAAFSPAVRRPSSAQWTQGLPAWAEFADGFALLVTTDSAMDELNRRLVDRGEAPVDMRRFRPNLVLTGLPAHEEDYIDTLTIESVDGPVEIKLVKPCSRCPIPNVDPDTGRPGNEPGDTLATYRADSRMNGAITFGMNGIVVSGHGNRLREGDPVEVTYSF